MKQKQSWEITNEFWEQAQPRHAHVVLLHICPILVRCPECGKWFKLGNGVRRVLFV